MVINNMKIFTIIKKKIRKDTKIRISLKLTDILYGGTWISELDGLDITVNTDSPK